MAKTQIKGVREEPSTDDGCRVLVDRIWPRGISKERAQLDAWVKEVAPSSDLRTWFDHRADRFDEFAERYRAELDDNDETAQLQRLLREHEVVTLLYAAHDPELNQAVVLLSWLRERRSGW